MFEVIIVVAGKVWASLVSDSGLPIAEVIFKHLSKKSRCILPIVYLQGEKGVGIFDVQVELMGKSYKGVGSPKLIL